MLSLSEASAGPLKKETTRRQNKHLLVVQCTVPYSSCSLEPYIKRMCIFTSIKAISAGRLPEGAGTWSLFMPPKHLSLVTVKNQLVKSIDRNST